MQISCNTWGKWRKISEKSLYSQLKIFQAYMEDQVCFKYNENKFTQTNMSISIIFNDRKLFVINQVNLYFQCRAQNQFGDFVLFINLGVFFVGNKFSLCSCFKQVLRYLYCKTTLPQYYICTSSKMIEQKMLFTVYLYMYHLL